jgi:hypothetical protein
MIVQSYDSSSSGAEIVLKKKEKSSFNDSFICPVYEKEWEENKT